MRAKNILSELQEDLLAPRESLAEVFHENSKLDRHSRRELGERVGRIVSSSLARRLPESLKSYPKAAQIELPRAQLEAEQDLAHVITHRRSCRTFDTARPLELTELATILQLSYGITGRSQVAGGVVQYLRAIPSAGALYPLEVYVAVKRVNGLEAGCYHYRVGRHALERLGTPDLSALTAEDAEGFGFPRDFAATVFVSGVLGRTLVKYLDRGYRFVLFEAGALAQQITLIAECQGISSCILGGFPDNDVNQLFELDGRGESMLLAVSLGRPRKKS